MDTPYDGHVGLWHVSGSWVGERTIDELAETVKRYTPTADGIYVKTSEGSAWQGVNDQKASMEINGPDDIKKWADTLARYDLDLHAWAIPKGQNIPAEIDLISRACQVPGVRSMILDVEPFEGYWRGTRQDAIRLMSGIRERVGRDFHIGMSVDPRRHWYSAIVPDAWRPYINSIHPQVYWELMGRDDEDVLTETYVVWGTYGLPIYPVLQAWNVSADAVREAQDIARNVRGATGLSYFRLGVISPLVFQAINDEVVDSAVGPDRVVRYYGWEKVIAPYEGGYMDGTQTGQPSESEFQEFVSVRGHKVKYKETEAQADRVYAQWNPILPTDGTYEVSVYIPAQHATTAAAQYHIHGIKGAGTELLVKLNQSRYANQWVPLVVYEFEGGQRGGQVNLTDLTGESNKEIAFGAVRWRQVIARPIGDDPAPVPQGFDAPVGTAEERRSEKVWPGSWFDATGFAVYYTAIGPSYHTGVDLNSNRPTWDSDRNAPVYAGAAGVVTFSGLLRGTWGHVIVIRHDPLPNGKIFWTRYAHVNNPQVVEGQRVERGEQIANIGNANGKLPYHLHYDVVKTDIVERTPGHWPGLNLDLVLQHYVDPKKFTQDNRPPRS